jgi:hypothetical protein
VRGSSRDHFGIVARERELAHFQTLYQVAKKEDSFRNLITGLNRNCVHIRPGRQSRARMVQRSLLRQSL